MLAWSTVFFIADLLNSGSSDQLAGTKPGFIYSCLIKYITTAAFASSPSPSPTPKLSQDSLLLLSLSEKPGLTGISTKLGMKRYSKTRHKPTYQE